MCYDYLRIENVLPKKIVRSRNRPNVSGIDKDYCDRTNKSYIGVHKTKTKNGKPIRVKDIGFMAESITFGQIKRMFVKNAQFEEAKANKMYPEVYKELKNMIHSINPNFKYNCITLNHNLKCIEHLDKYNCGASIIVGFGKYWGGELVVEKCPINIRYKPHSFNGSKLKHYTNEFMGDRWSAIFFYKQR